MRGGDRSVPSSGRGPLAERHHRELLGLLAPAGGRLAAAVARAREGCRASGARGDRQRGVGSVREVGTQTGVEAARGHDAEAARVVHRFPLHHRRADARGGVRDPGSAGAHEGRPRSGAAAHGLSRLHDLGRMDGLLRRQGPRRVPRGARRRLDALQGQGRRRSRRRCEARGHGAGGDRSGSRADDRREPAMGRRRGDRADAGPRAIQAAVDRGADEPGRRARAQGDRGGDPARSAWRPASTARTA